ncbi:MAG: LysR family transcriptional regulator [Candidimonas sp.]
MAYAYNDLICFLAVVEHGQLSRAAGALQLSQPAVTKIIRRLEDALGVPLFQRGAHGVTLTADGQLFLNPARKLVRQHEDTLRVAADIQAKRIGLLRVGLTLATSTSSVPQAIATLIRMRPGLRVKLEVDKSDRLLEALEDGSLDLIVVPTYMDQDVSSAYMVIGSDELSVAARLSHPLSAAVQQRKGGLRLAQTREYGWALPSRDTKARRHIEQQYQLQGLAPPTAVMEIQQNMDAVVDIVSRTDLLCFVPAYVLRQASGRLQRLRVEHLALQRNWLLMHRPHSPWTSLMKDLRDLLVR